MRGNDMKEKQPLLTVSVPVYATEEFFERCVDSILASEYKNLEVLLIDDGSPDNCPKLCDEYAKKDSRIRVFHKENGGCHSAQNMGIANARGEYMVFCDNDDMVSPEAYRILMEKALETDADYVQGTVRRTNSNTGEVRLWERKDSDNVKTKIIGFQGGIYRTKMLQECGVKFGPFRIGDDTCFALMVLHYAKNIVYINDITYEYFIRPLDAKEASAMQQRNFAHYYDDLRWRNWALHFIDKSEKLSRMTQNDRGEFCMVIDENWLKYSEVERKKCFEELQGIVRMIDWKNDRTDIKGFIQVAPEKFLDMQEEDYTKYLKREFEVLRPMKNRMKKILPIH